jgi:ribonuclease HI
MTGLESPLSLVQVETTVRETYEREAGPRKRAVSFKPDRELDSEGTWMFTDGASSGWHALVVLRPGEGLRLVAREARTDTRNVGAEMAGLVSALEAIVPGERVAVVTDFLWAIYYVLGWYEVKNALLREQVAAARALLVERRPASLRYIHVKGHLRDETALGHWNAVADQLCGLACEVEVALPRATLEPPGARPSLAALLAGHPAAAAAASRGRRRSR